MGRRRVVAERAKQALGATGMIQLPRCNRTIPAGVEPDLTVPGMNGLVTGPSLRQPGDLRSKGRGEPKAREVFAPHLTMGLPFRG